MDERTKISVIVPVYNVEQHIEECLESILRQTLKQIKIICVDDGSTDGTSDILYRYKRLDKRIHIYKQKNAGPGIARNFALEKAKSDYVAFLDADDYYLDKTALEKMYNACSQYKVEVCGGLRCEENQGQIVTHELHRKNCSNNLMGGYICYRDYQYDLHFHNYIFSLPMLKKNGIRFPEYREFEDPPFFVKAMIVANRFFVIPVEFYCYRKAIINESRRRKYLCDLLKGLIDNLIIAEENGLDKLFRITMDRINHEFSEIIAENAFDNGCEALSLLIEANKIVARKSEEKLLKPLEILRLNGKTHIEVLESHRVITKWLKIKVGGKGIAEYLISVGINTVAIHGMGFFGSLLFEELENSPIEIRYMIDQKINNYKSMTVFEPEEVMEKVDAILITPLESEAIYAYWNRQKRYRVLVLKNILERLVNNT